MWKPNRSLKHQVPRHWGWGLEQRPPEIPASWPARALGPVVPLRAWPCGQRARAGGLSRAVRPDNHPLVQPAGSASQGWPAGGAFITHTARNNGDSHSYLPLFAQPVRGSQVRKEKPILPGFPPNWCIERDMGPNSREPRLTAMELDPHAGHAARLRAVR